MDWFLHDKDLRHERVNWVNGKLHFLGDEQYIFNSVHIRQYREQIKSYIVL